MNAVIHPAAAASLDSLSFDRTISVLLHGPSGVGAGTVARELTRRAICAGCLNNSCADCRRFDAGTHGNVVVIGPDEKGKIGIAQIHELTHALSFRQDQPGTRVAVIEGADTMTLDAQNALLKSLEEPPTGTVIILTAASAQALLPTIRSRVQAIYLPPPGAHLVADYLVQHHLVAPGEAAELAGMGDGLPAIAIALHHDQALRERVASVDEFRQRLTGGPVFARLSAAYEVSKKPELISPLVDNLQRWARQQLRRTQDDPRPAEAVERLRLRLRSNVAVKTALEALALEVAS